MDNPNTLICGLPLPESSGSYEHKTRLRKIDGPDGSSTLIPYRVYVYPPLQRFVLEGEGREKVGVKVFYCDGNAMNLDSHHSLLTEYVRSFYNHLQYLHPRHDITVFILNWDYPKYGLAPGPLPSQDIVVMTKRHAVEMYNHVFLPAYRDIATTLIHVVHGYSLGSGVACHLYATIDPTHIDLILLSAAFTGIHTYQAPTWWTKLKSIVYADFFANYQILKQNKRVAGNNDRVMIQLAELDAIFPLEVNFARFVRVVRDTDICVVEGVDHVWFATLESIPQTVELLSDRIEIPITVSSHPLRQQRVGLRLRDVPSPAPATPPALDLDLD